MSKDKKLIKVAIVGGGSYLWSFGFVRQFVKSKNLTDVRVMLMDIDSSALKLVSAAADLYNRSRGSPVQIETTMDLNSALEGADYVLISISTGGLEAMRHDLEIPEKYGIYHTVGDTVGPGGWLRAVRNIPVFYDFGERIKRLCPDAWVINVSNPLTALTRVLQRDFLTKVIGMCPGVESTARALATLAGADEKSFLEIVVTGVDHGSWFTRLYADGMDVLQKLKNSGYCRVDDSLPTVVKVADPLAEGAGFRAGFAVWHEIGYLPSIPDRHAVENWPWCLLGDKENLPFGIKRTFTEDRIGWRRNMRERLEEYVGTGNENVLEHLGHGDDPVVKVIESLSGYDSFLWTSNYLNVGQTPSLPEGAVVETRCLFDGTGVHPLSSPMPEILKVLVLPQVLRQESIIDIALKGSFDELVALVFTDPLCSRLPIGQCRQMVREMLLANRSLIKNPGLFKGAG